MITVSQIGRVFVKATQFLHPDEVEIVKSGIRHDRDFALAEENDTLVSSSNHGTFFPLRFTFDAASDSLRLEFPEGRQLEGPARGSGRSWDLNLHGLRTLGVAVVEGSWTEVLSAFAGRPIRLVRCVTTGAAIDVLPITLVTTSSLRRLEREVGAPVDPSRFRAGFVLENAIEHEEDAWDGRQIRIGTATLKVRTPVPRCAITGFNPTKGIRDQEVMKSLIRYRDKFPLPDGMLPGFATPGFAAYAEVIEPGFVRTGDQVEFLS